jgi:hypothetical protein
MAVVADNHAQTGMLSAEYKHHHNLDRGPLSGGRGSSSWDSGDASKPQGAVYVIPWP